MKSNKEIKEILKTHTVISGKIRCNHHFCDYDGMTVEELKLLLSEKDA